MTSNINQASHQPVSYATAILSAFEYLLSTYPEVFVYGQGLWSPWYVGNTMTDLDKKFGPSRVIDSPVSESACTGAAVGASLTGSRPIVVHPRMDFMLYAMDPIVNQAAKWSYMFGGQAHPCLTIRSIINRGGEQGAQHSQALHSWFAHVPGLRVVMPSTVSDARDLLIASVLSNDPVIYIDDRWLYDQTSQIPPIQEFNLNDIKPQILSIGSDLTIVSCGFATSLALQASGLLTSHGFKAEVIDLRVLNPFKSDQIVSSVIKTGRLLVLDVGWKSCGVSSEVLAATVELIPPSTLLKAPIRLTLPSAPAPSSSSLESNYYFSLDDVVRASLSLLS